MMMEKCSNWLCSLSNNINYNNPQINNSNSNTSVSPILNKPTTNGFLSSKTGTSASPSVTFFNTVTNMENGAVATVLNSPEAATPTAGAASSSLAQSAAPASSSPLLSTKAKTQPGTTNSSCHPNVTSSSLSSSSQAMTCAATTLPSDSTTVTASSSTGTKPKQYNSSFEENIEEPGPSPSAISLICDETEIPAKNCFRLVMLGSARTGKTALVRHFLGQAFEEKYFPTIDEFHRKIYRIRNEVYQLDILDTSGYNPFPAMRRVCLLTVFSMNSRESFEEVVRLREDILETKSSAASSSRLRRKLPRVPMVIAGNKCDRENKIVQIDEVKGYIAGQDSACVFVECSAKNNFHVEELFSELFAAANLPQEMAPNHHRCVTTGFGAPSPLAPHGSTSKSKKVTLSIKRRLSDACAVVTPNVRRPSIRSELTLMRTKTNSMGDSEKSGSKHSGRICAVM